MDELALQINNAPERDFPAAKLRHAPHTAPGNGEPKTAEPTLTAQIVSLVAGLQARIAMLEKLRGIAVIHSAQRAASGGSFKASP